jgi:uncharacterized protein YjiS (DUF1127 family)
MIMLSVGPKGNVAAMKALTPPEDELLRQGFGRYALPQARTEAAAVVRRYQHREAGMWFYCDCLPDGQRPAALVPVDESHIRRHCEMPWPAHDEECDFFSEPAEQHAATRSYRRPVDGIPFNLIKSFGSDEDRRARIPPNRVSYARSRPSLARLLARLLTDAGLQTIPPNWKPLGPAPQYEALRAAAMNIDLVRDVPLSHFAGFSAKPDRVALLKERIDAADEKRFGGSRPHGVLVFVAQGAAGGKIMTKHHPPLPVRGRIGIFGEREGHRAVGDAAPGRRAPYLAVCLIARPDKTSKPEILKAYLHPCRSAAHLILLDSDHERETLNELIGIQRWLDARCGVATTIEKPLFDVGPDLACDGQPRPPCVPDFILRVQGESPEHPAVIVETVGYADDAYRQRKLRMHEIMAQAFNGAPVVSHDFVHPEDMTQEERGQAAKRAIIRLVLKQKRTRSI